MIAFAPIIIAMLCSCVMSSVASSDSEKVVQVVGHYFCQSRLLPRELDVSCQLLMLFFHTLLSMTIAAVRCRVPEECPQATADVVNQCLDENAEVRPSAREIVEALSQIREPTQ